MLGPWALVFADDWEVATGRPNFDVLLGFEMSFPLRCVLLHQKFNLLFRKIFHSLIFCMLKQL